jgi:HAMP domain-containing protein
LGDKIVAKWKYSLPVEKITGFHDGAVVYLTPSGAEKEKPLRDIAQIAIDGQEAFNQAEQLRDENKAADAVEAYDAVINAADPPWVVQIARSRKAGLTTRPPLPASNGAKTPASAPARDSGVKRPPNPAGDKAAELDALKAEVDRLRQENRRLRGALEKAGIKAEGEPAKPVVGDQRPHVDAPAPKAAAKAGVVTSEEILPVLLQGLAKAANAETALRQNEQEKKLLAELKARLSKGTLEISYPIGNIAKSQEGYRVYLAPPSGWPHGHDAPGRYFFQYPSELNISLPEADALKVKPGWLLTVRCNADCVAGDERGKAGILSLVFISTRCMGDLAIGTVKYTYAVHPAKVESK